MLGLCLLHPVRDCRCHGRLTEVTDDPLTIRLTSSLFLVDFRLILLERCLMLRHVGAVHVILGIERFKLRTDGVGGRLLFLVERPQFVLHPGGERDTRPIGEPHRIRIGTARKHRVASRLPVGFLLRDDLHRGGYLLTAGIKRCGIGLESLRRRFEGFPVLIEAHRRRVLGIGDRSRWRLDFWRWRWRGLWCWLHGCRGRCWRCWRRLDCGVFRHLRRLSWGVGLRVGERLR